MVSKAAQTAALALIDWANAWNRDLSYVGSATVSFVGGVHGGVTIEWSEHSGRVGNSSFLFNGHATMVTLLGILWEYYHHEADKQ